MSTLRIVSLQAQNILRLSAVEIKWDVSESVLTLGGKNGAGKSSVIQCVAMALGGKPLCPEEPLKRGELTGSIDLDLGELRIRREFSRDMLDCDCEAAAHELQVIDVDETVMKREDLNAIHTKDCASHRYGDTKSRLVVRNADNITQGTPQAILDKLIGRMTFDPMAFVNMDPKPQEDVLRRIVNLDVSAHELRKKAAFELRTGYNKQYKDAMSRIDMMPTYDDAPAEEISFDEITRELQRAEELRNIARDADSAARLANAQLDTLRAKRTVAIATVDRIQRELDAAQADVNRVNATIEHNEAKTPALTAAADAAKTAVPDISATTQRMKDVETTNVKVRANRAYIAAAHDAKTLDEQALAQGMIIDECEIAKRAALDAAQFPVPGLSLSDHGVTFNGLPFKQASTAEQIRVSVAIGFALHPKLKLLLVKNGNALDDDSLSLIAREAAAVGGQILMEYVTKDAADVSVFIEDGHTV